MLCKKMFAKSIVQKMADLSSEHLEGGCRPFMYTGLDCVGPFLIEHGHAEVKCYALHV